MPCSHTSAAELLDRVYKQLHETVEQDAKGVTVRLATITCGCGWERGITEMYRCFYCKEWLCDLCGETHFGMSREQYYRDKAAGAE